MKWLPYWLSAALMGCGSTPAPPLPLLADTIYQGGPILTMVGDTPQLADALATRDGKILAVGALADVQGLKGEGTAVHDLQGNTLLPGFIDAHSHFALTMSASSQVAVFSPPMGTVATIPGLLDQLVAFRTAHNVPEGGWIVAYGYDNEGLAEGRHLTAADIDAVLPQHNVVVIHVSGHGGVLNGAAMTTFGVGPTTPTPPGGLIARIPGTNQPAGLLMETAWFPVILQLPRPSDTERLEQFDAAQTAYLSQGYTHAQDGASTLLDMAFYRQRALDGDLRLDLITLGMFSEAEDWIDDPEWTNSAYTGRYRHAGLKLVLDGSPQGKTAYVTTPYLTGGPDGQTDWSGEPAMPQEQVNAWVERATRKGLQVYAHVNGDAAMDQLIVAVRDAGITGADDRRAIAIHSQFQRPDHLATYAELGIHPSYFSNHVYYWGDVHIKNLGQERAAFISPLASARKAGLITSNHTDHYVTPLDPFHMLWTSMARQTASGVELGPDERLDAYAALQQLTTGPAWQAFEDGRKGALRPGLLADFVVLSGNPLEVGVDGIRALKVVETIKEDTVVYRAPEAP